MVCKERKLLLSTGSVCVLRAVRVEDAALMLDCYITNSGETPFLMRYPEELTLTLFTEREIIARKLESPVELMIGAYADGLIVGSCSVQGVSTALRQKHRASVGIAVRREYWRQGIGREMMLMGIEAAREMGFERLELGVLEGNESAITLYRKLGFVETGRIPHAMKYRDGSYKDETVMSMDLLNG